MSVLVLENFTDPNGTLLTAHTSDSGATWSRRSDSDVGGDMKIVTSGHCYASPDSQTEHALVSVIPGTADYTVETTIVTQVGTASNQFSTIEGRMSTDGQNGYVLYLDMSGSNGGGGAGVWTLAKVVAGVTTTIGTPYFPNYSQFGATTTVQLVMVGTAISGVIDSVTQITATDSAVSAIGRAGIGGFGVNAVNGPPQITQFRLLGAASGGLPVTFRGLRIPRR